MKKITNILTLLLVFSLIFTSSAVSAFAATANVSFENEAEKFVFLPGSEYSDTDLFDNFKNMMPGDTRTQTVVVTNNYSKFDRINVYLRAVAHDSSNPLSESVAQTETIESMNEFLSQLSMTVRKDGRVIYNASPDEVDGLSSNVLIGTIAYGETVKLDVELHVPIELGNDYANRVGEVDWVFTVEEVEDDTPIIIPQFARATITAMKLMDGAIPTSNDFTFQLTDSNGKVIQTVNNKGSEIIFNTLTFWTTGVYTYYLTEKAGTDSGIRYDSHVYTVTITVNNILGYVYADVEYAKDGSPYSGIPVFCNMTEDEEPDDQPDQPDEKLTPITLPIFALKTLNRHVATGSDFTFHLLNADGKALQTKQNTDGYVLFDMLKFDTVGTYTYYITEQIGTVEDMIYDTSVFKVTVDVYEKDGSLHATVSYEKNGEKYDDTPLFTNFTEYDPEIPPETSDSGMIMYIALGAVSIIAIIAVVIVSLKKKKQ